MKIINQDRYIGFEGESNSRELLFDIEDEYKEYLFYLDYVTPDKIKSNTSYIDITRPFKIPRSWMKEKGFLKVQLICEGPENFMLKSDCYTFKISESINSEDLVEEDEEINNTNLYLSEYEIDQMFKEVYEK